jgi:hypothetical protein
MRVSRRSWTSVQIDLLCDLVQKGVSPARASVVLKRPKLAVQNKARQVGQPFPDVRDVRAARLAREISQLESIERHDARNGRPGEADARVNDGGHRAGTDNPGASPRG